MLLLALVLVLVLVLALLLLLLLVLVLVLVLLFVVAACCCCCCRGRFRCSRYAKTVHGYFRNMDKPNAPINVLNLLDALSIFAGVIIDFVRAARAALLRLLSVPCVGRRPLLLLFFLFFFFLLPLMFLLLLPLFVGDAAPLLR